MPGSSRTLSLVSRSDDYYADLQASPATPHARNSNNPTQPGELDAALRVRVSPEEYERMVVEADRVSADRGEKIALEDLCGLDCSVDGEDFLALQ